MSFHILKDPKVKSIANYISVSRIVLAFALAFIKPLSTAFFIIYILGGISDVLDGYIARKTNTVSKLGDNIDSIADFIMIVILIIVLYPILNPTVEIVVWIAIIGIVKVISLIVVFVKYKLFEMLHTYANKFTGFLLFVFPISLIFVWSNVFNYTICIVASISAIEEVLINLSSKEFQINKKTILK